MDSTGLGIIAVTIVAFILLFGGHFVSRVLVGEIGLLKKYVVGTMAISFIFGGWCVFNGHWVAYAAYWGGVAGAGLGTLCAHGIDNFIGQRRELKLLKQQLKRAESYEPTTEQ